LGKLLLADHAARAILNLVTVDSQNGAGTPEVPAIFAAGISLRR